MKKSTLAEIQGIHLPWIVFQLNDAYYAISARYVSAISLTAEDCTPIPQSKPHVRGLISFRSGTVQVVDLHRLFGFPTLMETVNMFKETIESSKSAHLNWIETLEQCALTGESFPLAADPRQCLFGKWDYGYQTAENEIRQALKAIEEQHEKLQVLAGKALSLGVNEEQRKTELLQPARNEHVQEILNLLDSIVASYEKHISELLLVLEKDGQSAAFAVDRIIGVQEIEPYADGNVRNLMENGYAVGIAKTPAINQPVLLLDERLLLNEIDA